MSTSRKPKLPLGVRTYCTRNIRRIFPAFLIVAFSVMLVTTVITTLRGLREGAMIYIRELEQFAIVFPKGESRIEEKFRESIEKNAAVEHVMEARNCVIRVKTLVSHLPFIVRGVSEADSTYLLDKCGVKLARGHLPTVGSNEVVVHELVMRANGWELNREFGWDVDDEDWMPGRFRIVGVLTGRTPCGVASLSFLKKHYPYGKRLWERLLVFPRPGKMNDVIRFLRSRKDIKVWDYPRAEKSVYESFENILIIVDAVSLLLVIVIAVVVGLLQNLFFTQRLDEFALLLAVGIPRGRLLRKVLKESTVILGVAWLLGVLVAIGLVFAFDQLVLRPLALSVPILQWLPIAGSLILPAAALLISGWTVVSKLSNLDPVRVIERRGG